MKEILNRFCMKGSYSSWSKSAASFKAKRGWFLPFWSFLIDRFCFLVWEKGLIGIGYRWLQKYFILTKGTEDCHFAESNAQLVFHTLPLSIILCGGAHIFLETIVFCLLWCGHVSAWFSLQIPWPLFFLPTFWWRPSSTLNLHVLQNLVLSSLHATLFLQVSFPALKALNTTRKITTPKFISPGHITFLNHRPTYFDLFPNLLLLWNSPYK